MRYPMPKQVWWLRCMSTKKLEFWLCDFFSIEVPMRPSSDGWFCMVKVSKGAGPWLAKQKPIWNLAN